VICACFHCCACCCDCCCACCCSWSSWHGTSSVGRGCRCCGVGGMGRDGTAKDTASRCCFGRCCSSCCCCCRRRFSCCCAGAAAGGSGCCRWRRIANVAGPDRGSCGGGCCAGASTYHCRRRHSSAPRTLHGKKAKQQNNVKTLAMHRKRAQPDLQCAAWTLSALR
jgi:hypothetical protein